MLCRGSHLGVCLRVGLLFATAAASAGTTLQEPVGLGELAQVIDSFGRLELRDDRFRPTRNTASAEEMARELEEEHGFWTTIITDGLKLLRLSLRVYTTGQHEHHPTVLGGLERLKIDRCYAGGVLGSPLATTIHGQLFSAGCRDSFLLPHLQTAQMAAQRDPLNLAASQLASIIKAAANSAAEGRGDDHAMRLATLRPLVGDIMEALLEMALVAGRAAKGLGVVLAWREGGGASLAGDCSSGALLFQTLNDFRRHHQGYMQSLAALLDQVAFQQPQDLKPLPAEVATFLCGFPHLALVLGDTLQDLSLQIARLTGSASLPSQEQQMSQTLQLLLEELLSQLPPVSRDVAKVGWTAIRQHHLPTELDHKEAEALARLEGEIEGQMLRFNSMEACHTSGLAPGSLRQYLLLSMTSLYHAEPFYHAGLMPPYVGGFAKQLSELYDSFCKTQPTVFEESQRALRRLCKCRPTGQPNPTQFRLEKAFIQAMAVLEDESCAMPDCGKLGDQMSHLSVLDQCIELRKQMLPPVQSLAEALGKLIPYWSYAERRDLSPSSKVKRRHAVLYEQMSQLRANLLLLEAWIADRLASSLHTVAPLVRMRASHELGRLSVLVPILLDQLPQIETPRHRIGWGRRAGGRRPSGRVKSL